MLSFLFPLSVPCFFDPLTICQAVRESCSAMLSLWRGIAAGIFFVPCFSVGAFSVSLSISHFAPLSELHKVRSVDFCWFNGADILYSWRSCCLSCRSHGWHHRNPPAKFISDIKSAIVSSRTAIVDINNKLVTSKNVNSWYQE